MNMVRKVINWFRALMKQFKYEMKYSHLIHCDKVVNGAQGTDDLIDWIKNYYASDDYIQIESTVNHRIVWRGYAGACPLVE